MSDSAIDTDGTFGGDTGGKQIRLAKKNIQTEYLISVLLAIRDFDIIIRTMTRADDPRFVVMARQIVNRVLDDEIKYKLLDAFDKNLEALAATSMDSNVVSMKKVFAAQDIVGEVNSYLDEYFALHKGQVIGDV